MNTQAREPEALTRDRARASLDPQTAATLVLTLARVLERRGGTRVEPTEDLVQTALLRLLEGLERFESRSALRTFAIGIALNVQREAITREQRRRRLQEHFVSDLEPTGEHGPEDLVALAELRRGALEALARLDAAERWILEARLVEGARYGELLPRYQAKFGHHIATEVGLRGAFFNARQRLLELMRRDGRRA